MSENNGNRRPDQPNAEGQNQSPNQAFSADDASGQNQRNGHDTQAFHPEGQGYPQGQGAYPPQEPQPYEPPGYGQNTQAFPPQGYGHDTQAFYPTGQGYPQGQGAYTPSETQAFAQQQGYPGQYGADQYGQPYGHQAYPPGGQPGAYPPAYGGHDGYGGGYPPYGGYGQQPPKGKGPLIAWIVLGVILLVAIVVGVLYATGVFGGEDDEPTATATETLTVTPTTDDSTDDPTTEDPTTEPPTQSPARYGDDPELDALWDECADGDMVACDDLYFSSDFGTEYEEFGNTCGESESAMYGLCEYSGPTETGSAALELDELADACEDGDWEACDELWWQSPIDSDYEELGGTCGGRGDYMAGSCEIRAEDGEF